MFGFVRLKESLRRRVSRWSDALVSIVVTLEEINTKLDRLSAIEKRIDRLDRFQRDNAEIITASLDRKLPEIGPRFLNSTPAKFKEISNKYAGERCFILGTGPSLLDLDLSLLKEERVFSVNGGINLLGDKFDAFCGYCIADPVAYRDLEFNIDVSRLEHFFVSSSVAIRNSEHLENAIVYDAYSRPKMHEGLFQFDLSQPIFESHTVIHAAIQIAVYMGFTTICLAGVDLDFEGGEPHFYKSSERELQASRTRSRNNQQKMYRGFDKANRILADKGVRLLNISPGGKLDCIERADFYSLFSDEKHVSPDSHVLS